MREREREKERERERGVGMTRRSNSKVVFSKHFCMSKISLLPHSNLFISPSIALFIPPSLSLSFSLYRSHFQVFPGRENQLFEQSLLTLDKRERQRDRKVAIEKLRERATERKYREICIRRCVLCVTLSVALSLFLYRYFPLSLCSLGFSTFLWRNSEGSTARAWKFFPHLQSRNFKNLSLLLSLFYALKGVSEE